MITAAEIVEAILTESAFVGNNGRPRGYLGLYDAGSGAMKTQWSDDVMADDHSQLGRNPHGYRWRYATNKTIPTVLWSTDPTGVDEAKQAVEEWLDKKGLKVLGHTTDFNRWMGY